MYPSPYPFLFFHVLASTRVQNFSEVVTTLDHGNRFLITILREYLEMVSVNFPILPNFLKYEENSFARFVERARGWITCFLDGLVTLRSLRRSKEEILEETVERECVEGDVTKRIKWAWENLNVPIPLLVEIQDSDSELYLQLREVIKRW
eukprot:TRINITY_DN26564_c0_g1_i1.p1 TRINITY_DN26564_c0_g1~~TRINITY_DN26564_c0_g1_i1.p1  ORF type:complete len:150 (+),score=24.69 TRINITY_DN26564_c0_g1_i1:3-452(+)